MEGLFINQLGLGARAHSSVEAERARAKFLFGNYVKQEAFRDLEDRLNILRDYGLAIFALIGETTKGIDPSNPLFERAASTVNDLVEAGEDILERMAPESEMSREL